MKWTEKKQQPHGIYAYKSVLFIFCVDFERNLVCFMNFFSLRVVFKWKFTVPASYTFLWLTWYFYLPFHFCRYFLLIFFFHTYLMENNQWIFFYIFSIIFFFPSKAQVCESKQAQRHPISKKKNISLLRSANSWLDSMYHAQKLATNRNICNKTTMTEPNHLIKSNWD